MVQKTWRLEDIQNPTRQLGVHPRFLKSGYRYFPFCPRRSSSWLQSGGDCSARTCASQRPTARADINGPVTSWTLPLIADSPNVPLCLLRTVFNFRALTSTWCQTTFRPLLSLHFFGEPPEQLAELGQHLQCRSVSISCRGRPSRSQFTDCPFMWPFITSVMLSIILGYFCRLYWLRHMFLHTGK